MDTYFYIVYAICALYLFYNFKGDLQMFQQNSYRIPRYWRWQKERLADTWRLADIAILFLILAGGKFLPICAAIAAIYSIVKMVLISRKRYKKPLVFTKRVWRLYSAAVILSGAVITLASLFAGAPTHLISGTYTAASVTLAVIFLLAICSWAPVIAADIILIPVEKSINGRFIRDAKRILASMPNLRVVGITGSYGKTSTKHFLNHILSEEFEVLMTPGSYNTPLGVVRTIREMMKPYHQIFICEMGAKQRGDIKEICDIVNPEMGILTAVGPMHLETFKSIENVRKTKFELIDSLPSNGLGVLNNDFPLIADTKVGNVPVLRYSVEKGVKADYHVSDISVSADGTHFVVNGPDGLTLPIETQLLGECNVSDLLAAIVIALHLGMSGEKIQYAVSSIKPVEHRLSIRRTPGGVTILDDAFNSNPAGSKMAMDVLRQFNKSGRRIVVTPGMIELGERQFDLNRELGKHIGESVDIAIVVGEYNREALCSGITDTDFPEENLHAVDSFNEAQQLLSTLLQPGDTLLYENDLPDTFK